MLNILYIFNIYLQYLLINTSKKAHKSYKWSCCCCFRSRGGVSKFQAAIHKGLQQEKIFELDFYEWEAINSSNIHKGYLGKCSKWINWQASDIWAEH